MKTLKLLSLAAALALLPTLGQAAPSKKPRPHHQRVHSAAPFVNSQEDMVRGNAALGGNNASSAFGSNSANENANGRSGGGFGS